MKASNCTVNLTFEAEGHRVMEETVYVEVYGQWEIFNGQIIFRNPFTGTDNLRFIQLADDVDAEEAQRVLHNHFKQEIEA